MSSESLDQFLEKQKKHPSAKEFLDDMDWRVVAINNKTDIPAEKERNHHTLITMIDRLVRQNERKVYTNNLFTKAHEIHNKLQSSITSSGWHSTLVSAVIEAFDTHFFSNLTPDTIFQIVIGILQKRNTGSVWGRNLRLQRSDATDKIEDELPMDVCEEQVIAIFETMYSQLTWLSKLAVASVVFFKMAFMPMKSSKPDH